MGDPNEITALKAAVSGSVSTADSLAGLRGKIDALDPHAEIDAVTLDELARIATAHALASAALRGLVETMMRRRAGATS